MEKEFGCTFPRIGYHIAMPNRRRICFVTGTRAEFGLMQTTLRAIAEHPKLKLHIVVTGMHLDRRRGRSVKLVADRWKIDALVPWSKSDLPKDRAAATGAATAELARTFAKLKSEVILVVGDRVEALSAAVAGHLSDLPVAHIHGGDRALGQADDSLRHAITKLSHIHFPATKNCAQRLGKLGEDAWRIHQVGAPGIDNIKRIAAQAPANDYPNPRAGKFALLVLHPVDPDDSIEYRNAVRILSETLRAAPQVVIVHPNNDPGAKGIARCWDEVKEDRVIAVKDLPRQVFLGLLRDAAFLIGNSSSGIIEAASFGTPVIDIGRRQEGREHGGNVVHCSHSPADIRRAIQSLHRAGRPRRFPGKNPYGGERTGQKIAHALASLQINSRLLRKLIAY
jgi:UDP-hydrolysing UDP-N-acetyl-D-glucosamine 2-epimerase